LDIDQLTIVVCCNKNDFFLARICIASIRYYYPSINIELIKDPGNGKVNSREVEKYFNVKIVDLKIKKMGWSGAKFHYLYQMPEGKKVLILDPDIVFIGPFLERLLPAIALCEYVVSADENGVPDKHWARITYFDIEAIQKAYPGYEYPGYFFNAGQIFLTTGAIARKDLDEFFNPLEYPFWKKQELFPLVDQSVYNYLLPALEADRKIRVGKEKFMIWGKSKELNSISLADIANKTVQSGLVHWAGCQRFKTVTKMSRGDILNFFEVYYYSKVRMGTTIHKLRKIIPSLDFYIRQLYYNLKPSRWLAGFQK
jgi:hypothetical protein